MLKVQKITQTPTEKEKPANYCQILCLRNGHVQIHKVSKSEYRILKKWSGMTAGKRKGIDYVGFREYLSGINLPNILAEYNLIPNPSEYQVIEVA